MENAIFNYGKEEYKGYTEDKESIKLLKKRKDCRAGCFYFHPDGTRAVDFIFTKEAYNNVAEILGLKKKKFKILEEV